MNNTNEIILDPRVKPVLKVKEVAMMMDTGTAAIYDLCHSEEFPAVKVGKGWRIPTERFIEWLSKAPDLYRDTGSR